jgi:hypothetical protein
MDRPQPIGVALLGSLQGVQCRRARSQYPREPPPRFMSWVAGTGRDGTGCLPCGVLEIRMVVVCRDCRIAWELDETALCGDASHMHREHEVHRHLSEVVLPDGTSVTAVSFHEPAPYERESAPDFGLYLNHRWDPPWAHQHVAWPDFGVPADESTLRTALEDLLSRARAGQQVELGCLGAHGRTGTALACAAVLAGIAPNEAVSWVRASYCRKAVETSEQAEFVCTFAAGSR